jgi:hypothetical protein
LAEVSPKNIPSKGTIDSQYGNICFPVWEQKIRNNKENNK